jgi:hypothetical protein
VEKFAYNDIIKVKQATKNLRLKEYSQRTIPGGYREKDIGFCVLYAVIIVFSIPLNFVYLLRDAVVRAEAQTV